VTVVTAFELDQLLAPVKARIKPQHPTCRLRCRKLTKRTISTLGPPRSPVPPNTFLQGAGGRKLVPLRGPECRAAITSGMPWPQIAGPNC